MNRRALRLVPLLDGVVVGVNETEHHGLGEKNYLIVYVTSLTNEDVKVKYKAEFCFAQINFHYSCMLAYAMRVLSIIFYRLYPAQWDSSAS